MNKGLIALFGGAAMALALTAGYFFNAGNSQRGMLFGAIALIFTALMISRMRAGQKKKGYVPRPDEPLAINPAFYGELNRLIDEGKDINGYLRDCDAPRNIVKGVNIGGGTRWYYHKDGLEFDEFCAELPHAEVEEIKHPYITSQRVEREAGSEIAEQIIKVDLYRMLWDWGEHNPKKRRYANSMRIAFHGAYNSSGESGGNSYLDMTIEQVRAARKANKKKPKKQRRKSDAGL